MFKQQRGKHKTHGKLKKAYQDWLSAIPHALMHSKSQRNVVSIYKCRCGAFHVGQQTRTKINKP